MREYRCPRCEGEGVILTGYDEDDNEVEMTCREFEDADRKYDMTEDICPDCSGRGYVPKEYFNFDGI